MKNWYGCIYLKFENFLIFKVSVLRIEKPTNAFTFILFENILF